MRFLADGPSIPDELLLARDEGRVLFFCGAGISRAKANLPGFLRLAEGVLRELRALPDSAARKLVEIAAELQRKPIKGVGGILAADRIFGLLERDFTLEDIERAVGRELTPADNVDLAAHRTMLKLGKNPAGEVQLITTNFDLLFEKAAPRLSIWTPSQLPDLKRNATFEGVVHLHGMFDPNYDHAIGGNLVLSSAEFGRAYLAEGWATDFIRSAIARYLIVFVGYAADDPPVQYLLEALNRLGSDQQQRLYAFQEGRQDETDALWKHKGVTAIAYQGGDNHRRLWETLEAWVHRARDPDRWREQLISRARRGPEAMDPHERGQIVHLAATLEGAQALAQAKRPLPSEWLCVFDPRIRFGPPGRTNFERLNAPEADPFMNYGLDSDPEPPKPEESEVFRKREIPVGALNPLLPVPIDGTTSYRGGLYSKQASEAPMVSPRLVALAAWFMRVCGQPAAQWWAAGQDGLHPLMLRNVLFELDNKNSTLSSVARRSWRYLVESWQQPKDSDLITAYALNQRLAVEGWNHSTRRAYLNLLRPVLTASRPYGAKPPATSRGLPQRQVVSLSLDFRSEEIEIKLPDSEIKTVLPALRKLLEDAGALQLEIHPYDINIPPIEPDPNLPGESSDRAWGLNPRILSFAERFRTLIQQDHAAALREFGAWPQDDDPIFERLRLWAAGIPGFLDATTSGKTFRSISDRVFWGARDQRDILIALSHRWHELSVEDQHALGARLRKGLPRERHYDRAKYPKWRAHSVLQRLTWLDTQGCHFDFDLEAVLSKEKQTLPEWQSEDAEQAADSTEGRGGIVKVDTSFSPISDTPLERLLETALVARTRRHGSLAEHDPYAGLVEKKPLRVLAALRRELVPSEITQQAWTRFLQSMARQKDSDRFCELIAFRLISTPPEVIETILFSASYWLESSAKRLFASNAKAARDFLDRLTQVIEGNPEPALPKALTGTRRDWLESSWNSVIGRLIGCLLADPELVGVKFKAGIPSTWKARANRLLQLSGDLGRFALAQLSRHLSWLYARDPEWTTSALVQPMETDGTNGEAALAGFFSNADIQGYDLFNRLRPILMGPFLNGAQVSGDREHALANLLITAWHVKSDADARFLSDDDLRIVIVRGSVAMRRQMLWQVGRWNITDKLSFLREVWPLQIAARGPEVSGRLCGVAFADEDNFSELVDAILPFLSPIQSGDFLVTYVHNEQSKIFERFPKKVLTLLSKVLPPNAADWPYSAAQGLDRIIAADPKLAADSVYRELRRRQRS